jgi:hypothetical protein
MQDPPPPDPPPTLLSTNRLYTVPFLFLPTTNPKVQTHSSHPSLVDTVVTRLSINSIIRRICLRTTLTLFVVSLVMFYPAVLIREYSA